MKLKEKLASEYTKYYNLSSASEQAFVDGFEKAKGMALHIAYTFHDSVEIFDKIDEIGEEETLI
jgi:hypothetical protein